MLGSDLGSLAYRLLGPLDPQTRRCSYLGSQLSGLSKAQEPRSREEDMLSQQLWAPPGTLYLARGQPGFCGNGSPKKRPNCEKVLRTPQGSRSASHCPQRPLSGGRSSAESLAREQQQSSGLFLFLMFPTAGFLEFQNPCRHLVLVLSVL